MATGFYSFRCERIERSEKRATVKLWKTDKSETFHRKNKHAIDICDYFSNKRLRAVHTKRMNKNHRRIVHWNWMVSSIVWKCLLFSLFIRIFIFCHFFVGVVVIIAIYLLLTILFGWNCVFCSILFDFILFILAIFDGEAAIYFQSLIISVFFSLTQNAACLAHLAHAILKMIQF